MQCNSGIPIQDDTDLYDYNVPERIATFVNGTLTQAQAYRGGHIMLTMGSDFQVRPRMLRPVTTMVCARPPTTFVPPSLLARVVTDCSTRMPTRGTRTWTSVSRASRPLHRHCRRCVSATRARARARAQ